MKIDEATHILKNIDATALNTFSGREAVKLAIKTMQDYEYYVGSLKMIRSELKGSSNSEVAIAETISFIDTLLLERDKS